MIIELNKSKSKAVLPFLSEEKEINLFFIGDIESGTIDEKNVKLFVQEENGKIRGVFLRYFDNFMLYHHGDVNNVEIVKLILKEEAKIISGEKRCVEPIFPFLKNEIAREKMLYFSKLTKLAKFEKGEKVRRATLHDAPELIEMLSHISEFRPLNEEAFLLAMKNATARRYFIRKNGKIVSTASTAAETTEMAMIVSVATLPEYRNQGLATKVVEKLCFDLLNEGKIPCLFYDNPTAGKIYERIGFRQIGLWRMFYLK